MHDTAAVFGTAFFRCYADAIEEARILEIGASDLNGALRGCAPYQSRYTGIDLEAGPGVDVVLEDPYTYPFRSATFDIIVSSSCLEHDPLFWISFTEMCRVARSGGFIYLNAPSNGPFHRYPTDNWRFYPDSGLALAAWGRRNGYDVRLIESFIGRRRRDVWNDCVMVFGKGKTAKPLHLLADLFPRSFNIRVGEEATISNHCEPTEDMTLRAWLTEKLRILSSFNGDENQIPPIEALISSLAEREVALGATERAEAERSAAADAQINALRGELANRDESLARIEGAVAELEAERDERATTVQRLEEEVAQLRSAVAGREATATRLVTAVAEREAALLAANDKAGAAETRLMEALSEVEAQRTRLAAVEAERDERATAVQRSEEEAARLRSAVAEREAAAYRLETTFAEREESLEVAYRRAVETQARLAMALGEIEALRAEAAKTETTARDRTAAGEAMRGEIASLRRDVDAARHVSRAMVAALRNQSARLPEPTPVAGGRGWAFLRIFGLRLPVFATGRVL